MLRIALPKGHLEKKTRELFINAGIVLTSQSPRSYHAQANDSRIARVTFMRAKSIPGLLAQGKYDIGITGSDMVEESQSRGRILTRLNYFEEDQVRVVLFGAADNPISHLEDIPDGAKIFSEYPRMTEGALRKAGKRASVYFSHGATEGHIPHDYEYGVCVAVTDTTLKANRLKIVYVLHYCKTFLIASESATYDPQKREAIFSLSADLQHATHPQMAVAD
jgi:ATP phosphoribosyltransferase